MADSEGRIASAIIRLDGENIALISPYAPNNYDQCFYDLLTNTMLESSDFKFIVGADFNAVGDYTLNRSPVTEGSDQKQASLVWANATCVNVLWRLINPSTKDFSYYSVRHKSFSRIDFVFASKNVFSKIPDVVHTPFTPSDHKAVVRSASLRVMPSKAAG